MEEKSKLSVTWKYFNHAFKVLCIGLTICMITLCCYNYWLDEDATVLSFQQFYDTKNDILPYASICITSPYEREKLAAYGTNVTSYKYSDFLTGRIWNDELKRIDYDSVVLNPSDYVLGYGIHYRNNSRVTNNYNTSTSGNDKNQNILLPKNRISMANMVCFGIDAILEKNIYAFDIKVKTNIFLDGIRPNYMTPLTVNRGLGVILHYPKQIFRTKWWTNYWPTRQINDSKNYMVSYDIRGMEVVRYRNKRAQPCNEGFPDYDEETLQEILEIVGCRPPYAKSNRNFTLCDNSEQMKDIATRQVRLWEGDNLMHLPCSGIEKLNTGITESDEDETRNPYFTISFNVKDITYKEIRMKKAYDTSALVGNVGGFIGLFLGYAIMMFPELLKGAFLHLLSKMGSAPVRIDKNTVIENGDSNDMKEKLDQLSNTIFHLHNDVASIKSQMIYHA